MSLKNLKCSLKPRFKSKYHWGKLSLLALVENCAFFLLASTIQFPAGGTPAVLVPVQQHATTDRQSTEPLFQDQAYMFSPNFCLFKLISVFPWSQLQMALFSCASLIDLFYIEIFTHIPICCLITVGVYVLIAEGRISVFSRYSVDAVPEGGLGSCDSTFVGICPCTNLCVFLCIRSFPTVFWFSLLISQPWALQTVSSMCNFKLQIINLAYLVYYVLGHLCAQLLQSCQTLCDPMDCM